MSSFSTRQERESGAGEVQPGEQEWKLEKEMANKYKRKKEGIARSKKG